MKIKKKEVVLDLKESDTGTIDIADPDTAYVKIGEIPQ